MDNDRANIAFLCRKHHADAHKRLDGRVGGGARPRVVAMMHDRALEQSLEARRLLSDGRSKQEVADLMGIHLYSLKRWLRKYPA